MAHRTQKNILPTSDLAAAAEADYQFITEGNNSETDTTDAYHKVWGKDSASMPSQVLPSSAPPQINQPGVFLNLVLLGFCGGFITKVQLTKSLTTDDSTSSPFPLLEGYKLQNLIIMASLKIS